MQTVLYKIFGKLFKIKKKKKNREDQETLVSAFE